MRGVARTLVVLTLVILAPSAALAQNATIAGVIKDRVRRGACRA